MTADPRPPQPPPQQPAAQPPPAEPLRQVGGASVAPIGTPEDQRLEPLRQSDSPGLLFQRIQQTEHPPPQIPPQQNW
jgi:hypothetical protein